MKKTHWFRGLLRHDEIGDDEGMSLGKALWGGSALFFLSSLAGAQPAPSAAPSTTTAPSATTPAPQPSTATTAPPPAPAPPPNAAPPYPYPYPYPSPYPYPYGPPQYAPPPYAAPPPPSTLPYSDGDPVPPGYHVESRTRRGPIIAGSIMAGVTYFVNILLADDQQRRGNDTNAAFLYVPGVGTWVLLDEECGSNSGSGSCQLLLIHSLTHSLGVGLVIFGLAAPKQILARDTASISIAPIVTGTTSGLSATGSF